MYYFTPTGHEHPAVQVMFRDQFKARNPKYLAEIGKLPPGKTPLAP